MIQSAIFLYAKVSNFLILNWVWKFVRYTWVCLIEKVSKNFLTRLSAFIPEKWIFIRVRILSSWRQVPPNEFYSTFKFEQKFKLSRELRQLCERKKLLSLTFTRKTTLWHRDRRDTPCSKVITVVVDAVTVIWPIWRGRRCGVDWTEGKKGWLTVRRLQSLALRGFLMPLLLVLSVETVPRTTRESKSFR